MKGFDIAQDVTGHAHQIIDAGYEAVGFYARSDRASKPFIDGLGVVGVHRFAIFERGQPLTSAYFSLAQACHDATSACAFLHQVGMPALKPIFFAVDYDASDPDIAGPIHAYMMQAQQIVKQAGFLLGVYGSGAVCDFLKLRGIAHYTMLAQSKMWAHYSTENKDIIQGIETKVLGWNVDLDTIVNTDVVW